MSGAKYCVGQWWIHNGHYRGPYILALVDSSPTGGTNLDRMALLGCDGQRWNHMQPVGNVNNITDAEWKEITGNEVANFKQVTKPMEIRRFNNVEVSDAAD
jgi:hypothetical protein